MDGEIYKLTEANSITLQVSLEGVSEDCNRVELKNNLVATMKNFQGVGLSANQCGIFEREFVMYDDFKTRETVACFNPEVIQYGTETTLEDEGCLTYPGLWLKIKRPVEIKVQFEDEFGEVHTKKYSGLESRVFQHELDHLNGIIFLQRASRFKIERALKARPKERKKRLNYERRMEIVRRLQSMESQADSDTDTGTVQEPDKVAQQS